MDETYQFAYLCQKDYIRKVSRKLPWGISESAYDELDNALNYKYKAFGIPYLKAKEDKENYGSQKQGISSHLVDLFSVSLSPDQRAPLHASARDSFPQADSLFLDLSQESRGVPESD